MTMRVKDASESIARAREPARAIKPVPECWGGSTGTRSCRMEVAMSAKNGLVDGYTFAVAMWSKKLWRSKWVRLSSKLTEDECREIVEQYKADPKWKGWKIRLGTMAIFETTDVRTRRAYSVSESL
jgi:hypothetical protein